MKQRFYHKTEGQNLILIAGVLTLLFGMAALAVDLGVTYAKQRNIVRGVNAASLNGMNRLISGGRDGEVEDAIVASLRSNGVPVTPRNEAPQPGDYPFEAIYLGGDGAALGRVGNYGDFPPEETRYIQVRVDGKVETFFARLFGQNELPVGATAYASVGACTTGYYPFGVHSTDGSNPMFNAEGTFANHDGFYIDQIYDSLRYKRLYLRDGANPNGGFSLLRWHKDILVDDTGALAEMLTGDGTYSKGYEEASWPENLPIETGYPSEPRAINAGDWVYGNTFESNPFNDKEVRNQLDTLKRNRTLMTLPIIYDSNRDIDDNPIHRILRFGAFLLIDYGVDKDGGAWMDLAYFHEGGRCASLVTSAPPTNNFTVSGNVTFIPRYQTFPDMNRPVQFLIILDASGSMSWSFDGKGIKDEQETICTDPSNGCLSSLSTAWRPQEERRIYIAKEVLKRFVDQIHQDKQQNLRQHDMVRIIEFKGDLGLYSKPDDKDYEFEHVTGYGVDLALQHLTRVLPESGWTNDVNVLYDAIRDAGKVNLDGYRDDPYLTNGATPSGVALLRASQVFTMAPKYVNPNDENTKYRRVVIFVTDGVANVLLNGLQNDYDCSNGSEDIHCQAGRYQEDENKRLLPDGSRRPIDEMVYQANELKQVIGSSNGDGAIYVVALSDKFSHVSLDQVASQPNYVKIATQEEQVQEIFDDIKVSAIRGECTPAQGEESARIESSNLPEGMRGVTGDSVFFEGKTLAIVGEVTLTDENGIEYKGWITADRLTRKLSYEIKNVPPGRYTLSAWLAYRARDGVARDKYELIVRGGIATTKIPVTVSVGRSLGGVIGVPLKLDLNENVCPAPS